MNWKSFLAAHGAAWLAVGQTPEVSAETRPNVLVILADDLGYADTGFTGSTEIFTPRLDALAAGGVLFENGYVSHPVCGPMRAGFITGRHQARFGFEGNPAFSPFDLAMGLPLDEVTIGDRMKSAGYRTGIIGKWHLGAAEPFHPNNRGFDYFYGFLGGGHTYWPENVTTHHPLLTRDGSRPHYMANESSLHPLLRNMNAAEFDEYLTFALSRDAARFVNDSDETPFFLYLAYNAPHTPLEAPEDLIEKYAHIEHRNRRIYAAMIDAMDQGIGMIVDALKESGRFENTLIFFLSDNGGVFARTPGDRADWADNSPFRAGKGSMLEGGIRIPFIAHWPAGIPAGQRFDGLVSSLDISATAAALAGAPETGPVMDGVNVIPFLTGEKSGSPHDALFWRMTSPDAWAIRTAEAKFLLENWGATEPELFDMLNDPTERNNLVHQRPEWRRALAQRWNDWNTDNHPGNIIPPVGRYQEQRIEFFLQLHEAVRTRAAQQPVRQIE